MSKIKSHKNFVSIRSFIKDMIQKRINEIIKSNPLGDYNNWQVTKDDTQWYVHLIMHYHVTTEDLIYIMRTFLITPLSLNGLSNWIITSKLHLGALDFPQYLDLCKKAEKLLTLTKRIL